MDLIKDIKIAKESGASYAELAKARQCQRKAEYYLDFVISENSMGFHSPPVKLNCVRSQTNNVKNGASYDSSLHKLKAQN